MLDHDFTIDAATAIFLLTIQIEEQLEEWLRNQKLIRSSDWVCKKISSSLLLLLKLPFFRFSTLPWPGHRELEAGAAISMCIYSWVRVIKSLRIYLYLPNGAQHPWGRSTMVCGEETNRLSSSTHFQTSISPIAMLVFLMHLIWWEVNGYLKGTWRENGLSVVL